MLQVTVAGRLTKDSELRTMQNGDGVLGFTVAVDVGYGQSKHAVFVSCSLFGKRGETLKQYLTKGASVTITGAGDLRLWESNGKNGASIECRVSEVTLQGGKRDGDESKPAQSSGSSSGWEPPADLDDDIPFVSRFDHTDILIGINRGNV